jgi:hypothetical protein
MQIWISEKNCNETRLFDIYDIDKHGGRYIELKRAQNESMINNYNEIILTLWEANMDLQPIGSEPALVYYICKYLTKHEPMGIHHEVRNFLAMPST